MSEPWPDTSWWPKAPHETVTFAHDEPTGLRAIFALHSTALGPALGGTRWYPYGSTDEALYDVLRLAEAMSYKAAAARLPLGGGKAVIIGNPETQRSPEVLDAYARMVDGLGGRYITAEDVGTTVEDMEAIRRVTPHVAGLPLEAGGSGDPSPLTALGVLAAIKSAAGHRWQSSSLAGRRVVVIGVGKVGSALVGHLVEEGCEVVIAEVDEQRRRRVAEQYCVEVVSTDDALASPCDVLSPAALGGALNKATIPQLQCELVVGAANNQLRVAEDSSRLRERGIVYVPDFLANAGGLINIAEELRGYDAAQAAKAVESIGDAVGHVLRFADEHDVDTHRAAVRLAQQRIDGGRGGLAPV